MLTGCAGLPPSPTGSSVESPGNGRVPVASSASRTPADQISCGPSHDSKGVTPNCKQVSCCMGQVRSKHEASKDQSPAHKPGPMLNCLIVRLWHCDPMTALLHSRGLGHAYPFSLTARFKSMAANCTWQYALDQALTTAVACTVPLIFFCFCFSKVRLSQSWPHKQQQQQQQQQQRCLRRHSAVVWPSFKS